MVDTLFDVVAVVAFWVKDFSLIIVEAVLGTATDPSAAATVSASVSGKEGRDMVLLQGGIVFFSFAKG